MTSQKLKVVGSRRSSLVFRHWGGVGGGAQLIAKVDQGSLASNSAGDRITTQKQDAPPYIKSVKGCIGTQTHAHLHMLPGLQVPDGHGGV